MRRFFVKPGDVDTDRGKVTIRGGDVQHIRDVLRFGRGDRIEVGDSTGRIHRCEIRAVEGDRILLDITDTGWEASEPGLELHLIQGLPQGRKMDGIIRRATEIGIRRILPALTARTADGLGKRGRRKRGRWQRVAEEAAKQSRRGLVPEVCPPVPLEKILDGLGGATLLVPWLGARRGIREVLREMGSRENPGRVAFFIGPEGGFEEGEVERILGLGGLEVSLGPRVLRTEHAGAIVAALLLYHFGEMDPHAGVRTAGGEP